MCKEFKKATKSNKLIPLQLITTDQTQQYKLYLHTCNLNKPSIQQTPHTIHGTLYPTNHRVLSAAAEEEDWPLNRRIFLPRQLMKVFEASEFMNGAVGFLTYQQRESRMERYDGRLQWNRTNDVQNRLYVVVVVVVFRRRWWPRFGAFLPRLENVCCLLSVGVLCLQQDVVGLHCCMCVGTVCMSR